MEILEQIGAYIQAHELFDPQEPILVAVSGGADSLCLLDGLLKLDYTLVAAHLDHQLRKDSDRDAETVERMCRQLAVPFVGEAEDVSALSHSGLSIETAARVLRYRFLTRVAIERGIRSIATGHTYDDQAETILMHFLRGAGPSGLRGMRPRTTLGGWVQEEIGADLWLARPLLTLTRAQTRAYCQHAGLTPIDDPTNLDRSYTRNRVRLELIPHLETFNPEIKANLNRIGEVMSGVEALMQELVQSAWSALAQGRADGSLLIRMPEYSEHPLALQREVMRAAVSRMKPGIKDLSFEIIEAGREFILQGATGARHTLLGGLELLMTRQGAILHTAGEPLRFPGFPQLEEATAQPITAPSEISLQDGWRVRIERFPIPTAGWREMISPDDDLSVVIDERGLPGELILRPPRPGDWFRPFGLGGRVKVGKFLIDQGVPAPARSRWPLICKGGRILWVVGLRVAEEGRLDAESRQALLMKLFPPEGGVEDAAAL